MTWCFNCFCEKTAPGPCPRCGYDPAFDEGKYPSALPHGSILAGQYVTGRVLGQGGFGVTYLALDIKRRERVAVKEYLPELLAGREPGSPAVTAYPGERGEQFRYGLGRFLEEAKTLAKFLGNPHIVGVRSYFEENGTAYFTMEYVEGLSLKAYLKSRGGRLPWQEAAKLLLPVMEALCAVHSAGLIHRDVAPDNICLTGSGQVKLLDFGAARYSLGDRSQSLDVVLKHGYAPVEQYTRRGRQGPYSDVYAVAATFYACVTGFLPPDAIDRMQEDLLILPSARGVELPPALENELLHALEVRASDRCQTMEELRDAVAQALAQAAAPEPEPQPASNAVPEPEPQPASNAVPEPVSAQPADRPAFTASPEPPAPAPQPAPKSEPEKKAPWFAKKRRPILIAAAAALLAGVLWAVGAVLAPEPEPVYSPLSSQRPLSSRETASSLNIHDVIDGIDLESAAGAAAEKRLTDEGFVDFQDPVLGAMLRTVLGKEEGEGVLPEELASITAFSAGAILDDAPTLTTAFADGTTFEGDWPETERIQEAADFVWLTGCTKLALVDTELREIAPLAELTQLTELELNRCLIEDLTPLAGLTGLKKLWVYNNLISDLTPLAGLTQLTYLHLEGNQITDLTPLAGLTGLTVLDLSDNLITDLTPLTDFTQLTTLDLDNNQIADLSLLSGLTKLRYLFLGNNQITDLGPLSGLTELKVLYLENNQITDLSPLSGLSELYFLTIRGNEIEDLTPVSHVEDVDIRS